MYIKKLYLYNCISPIFPLPSLLPLDFEDVGVKPTASSEKKETWDWDDDDLEEWLSVEK